MKRALVATAALLLVLTGCTPQAPAEPEPIPSATWSAGAPAGPLDDDAWVVAARASLEAQAASRNRNDFSIAGLAETTGSDLRNRLYSDARNTVLAGKRTDVLPGPTPFAPTDVEVAEGGRSAVVQGCLATNWGSQDGVVPTDLAASGIQFTLELDGERTVLTENLVMTSIDCAGSDLPVALFDPAPEPSGVTDAGDIVRPGGADDEG